MRKFFVSLALVAATALPSIAKGPIRQIEGTVVKVSDGDTVQVQDRLGTKIKVRFYGIDSPETEKSNKKTGHISKPGQPFGDEADKALRSKITGKKVRLDVMATDRYGRTVSLMWLNERNINREMVREGWAWAYRTYLDRAHASEFIADEQAARNERRGLWNQTNPEPPWEFRKRIKAAGDW